MSMPTETERYTFCETLTSGVPAIWHIRVLDSRGKFPSGIGFAASTLCDRKPAWDMLTPVDADGVRFSSHAVHVCKRCRAAWEKNHMDLA